jgi:biofilm PGA synthesis lipoprotein PgaB
MRLLLTIILLPVLLLGSFPLRSADQIIILQYHHVDRGTPAATSITPQLFEQHIKYLQEHDYAVLPLASAITALRNGQPLPERAVALTVDDGYQSVYTEIYPRMKKLRWPFTVFVNPAAHDSGSRHYLSWDQIHEMSRSGVVFANHTNTHPHMLRMLAGESEAEWLQRIKSEIRTAQQKLQDELGQAPMLFVYPYGEHNPALRKLVSRLGYVGFGQQSGPVGPQSDFSALPRFPMAAGFASMERFMEKLNTRPLPVISVTPENPVLPGDDSLPELRLTLGEGDFQRSAVSCYISGQGRGRIAWDGNTLVVMANKPLPVGRSRFNCTAPSEKDGSYYWFSYAWFKKRPDGSWYEEY